MCCPALLPCGHSMRTVGVYYGICASHQGPAVGRRLELTHARPHQNMLARAAHQASTVDACTSGHDQAKELTLLHARTASCTCSEQPPEPCPNSQTWSPPAQSNCNVMLRLSQTAMWWQLKIERGCECAMLPVMNRESAVDQALGLTMLCGASVCQCGRAHTCFALHVPQHLTVVARRCGQAHSSATCSSQSRRVQRSSQPRDQFESDHACNHGEASVCTAALRC